MVGDHRLPEHIAHAAWEHEITRTRNILVGVALAPLVILFAIVASPFMIVMETRAAISLRVFRRREAGHVFLICTAKRNWHDFLQNNVIPVLPDNFRVVWHKSGRNGEYPDLIAHLARSRVFGVPKPYIVAVTPRALLHKSLNHVLQELKAHPKRATPTQQACLEIINKELEALRTSP